MGLMRVGYHVSMDERVANPEMIPTNKQEITAIIPLLNVIFFKLLWIRVLPKIKNKS